MTKFEINKCVIRIRVNKFICPVSPFCDFKPNVMYSYFGFCRERKSSRYFSLALFAIQLFFRFYAIVPSINWLLTISAIGR